ncbi:TPA: hypothetical protein ACH3X3_010881 [Trebouxia sp. C0006]
MPGRPGRFGAGRPTTIEFEPSSFAAQVEYRSNVTASAPHRFYGQHAAGLFTGSNSSTPQDGQNCSITPAAIQQPYPEAVGAGQVREDQAGQQKALTASWGSCLNPLATPRQSRGSM